MLKLKEKEKENKIEINEAAEKAAEKAAGLTLSELDVKAGGTGSGSKISQILKQARGEGEKNCPTCGTGHIHHEDGTTKCSNGECGTEFVHIPKISEKTKYKCTTCGVPHARPLTKELQQKDKCPVCGSDDFINFNWDKVVKNEKKE